MSRRSSTPNLPFYDAYCFPASPTYSSWCLLTAADVHHLDHRPTFKEQGIYFYQNHPIKFVQLVGVVTTFEFHEKCIIFVLDDSSGATLEVKAKPLPLAVDPSTTDNTATVGETSPSLEGIDIGTVVKVKGQIGSFWDTRQLNLKRISIIRDTNEEVHNWNRLVNFRTDILSIPWFLDEAAQRRLLAKANGETLRNRERKNHPSGSRRAQHGKKQRQKGETREVSVEVTDKRRRPKQQQHQFIPPNQASKKKEREEEEDTSKEQRKHSKQGQTKDQKAKDWARSSSSSSTARDPASRLIKSDEEKAQEKFNTLRRRIAEVDNLDALGF